MKNIFASIIVLFVVLMSTTVFAQSSAEVKDVQANAAVTQEFKIGDQINSSVITEEKRQMINAYPGTMGNFVNAPMTPDMKSWVPIIGDPHFKKVSYNKLANFKVTCPGLINGVVCMYDLHIAKEFLLETTYGKVAENENDIAILQYPSSFMHEGDEVIQTVIISGDPRFTDEAPIIMALARVKEKSHSSRVYLEARLKSTNMNEGLSLATGAAGSMISQSPDNVAGAIALGGLIGKTWAYVWKNYDIQIKALNDGKTDLPAEYAQAKQDAQDKTKKDEEIKKLKEEIEILKLRKEKKDLELSLQPPPAAAPIVTVNTEVCELPAENIYFGNDSAVLDVKAKVAVKKLANAITGNKVCKKIMVEGNCSVPGTSDYNLKLGKQRAQAVADELKKYGISSIAFRFVSAGKTYADKKDDRESRKVVLRAVDCSTDDKKMIKKE